ncbi:MAG TPA: methyltransferase [Aeromicrobium sp.]|nr:methyltransferase [Aeromicrobium sp.]
MTDHYFAGDPTTPDLRRDVTARIWDHDLTFSTSTGVFAHTGIDKATDVLLRSVEPPSSGTVLDLGCGWGPIACALAVTEPALDVWAVDINTRARDLTRLNADRLGAELHVVHPDQVPADLTFDQIWSNPPIRIGKDALHELLLQWLPRLSPDGTAWLVVGKNLGADSLQRWLTGQGWTVDRYASAKGFRVLRVRASTPGSG